MSQPNTFGQPPKDSTWPNQDFKQSNFDFAQEKTEQSDAHPWPDFANSKTWKEKMSKHVDNPYKIAEENETKTVLATDDYMFPNADEGSIVVEHPNILKDQNYKFNEDELVDELKEYIDGTYESHYSKNQFQSTEFIVDCGHGDGFCLGNIIKYAQRYGKKVGESKSDNLKKIIHYALIAMK